MLAWAHTMLANQLRDQAESESDPERADELFARSETEYDSGLKIKPDMHEALNNWGSALSAQAKTKTGEEADKLYAQAYEKYEAALKIKPDKHDALNNWGETLSEQAKTKIGEEADKLNQLAKEKFGQAESLRSNPSKTEN